MEFIQNSGEGTRLHQLNTAPELDAISAFSL